jgi:hypothetical protein
MGVSERLTLYSTIASEFDASNFGGDVELAQTSYMTRLLKLASITHPDSFQTLQEKYITLPSGEYREVKRLTCQ